MCRRPATILRAPSITVGISIRGVNENIALFMQGTQELSHPFECSPHEARGFGLVVRPGGDFDIEPEGRKALLRRPLTGYEPALRIGRLDQDGCDAPVFPEM